MATPLALIVENRPAAQPALARVLQDENCRVLFADDFKTAIAAFRPEIDIVICRRQIGADDGIELMRQWRQRRPEASFIFVIDQERRADAREMTVAGAAGFLQEPIDPVELRAWVRRCLALQRKNEQLHELQLRLDKRLGFEALVGQSNAMRQLIAQARAAAESTSAVLIGGEPGTGKTLLAETIHQNSRRRAGPFVAFEVTGFGVRQVEQELFGISEGSSLAAAETDPGCLARAVGGTLLINDVAELAAVTQTRLLRSLERRGGQRPERVTAETLDVRIIAASQRKLAALAAEGRFSTSLFRRLSEVRLQLPPLRERREDILPLVNHLLQRACKESGRHVPALETELSRFFERFDWPENVRQLRGCLESMLAQNKSDLLTLDDLPARIDDPAPPGAGMYFPAEMSLAELERSAVEQALARNNGNRTRAAERLGISVRTLQRKLKLWSMEGVESDSVSHRGA